MRDDPIADLLSRQPRIINVGLEGFARELASLNVPVVQVDWSPPAGGDAELADLLSKLGT